MKIGIIPAAVVGMALICGSAGCSAKTDSTDGAAVGAMTSASQSVSSASDADNFAVSADIMAQAALNAVEFPKMDKAEDAETTETLFGSDISLCDDYAFYYAPMNVHNNEVIVLKPKDGKLDELKAQLESHLEIKRQDAAFYPDQQEALGGAVLGVSEGGYIYLIIHKNGSAAAEALLSAE